MQEEKEDERTRRGRRNRAVWPWVVGTTAVLVLVALLFGNRRQELASVESGLPPIAAPAPGTVPAGAAADFATWVRSSEPRADDDDVHAYAAAGIRRLASTIPEFTDREVVANRPLDEHLHRLTFYADSLSHAPDDADAGVARSAFLLTVELLDDIRRIDHPGEDVTVNGHLQQTRTAAGWIDARQPLEEQMEEVERFFVASSNLLATIAAQQE